MNKAALSRMEAGVLRQVRNYPAVERQVLADAVARLTDDSADTHTTRGPAWTRQALLRALSEGRQP